MNNGQVTFTGSNADEVAATLGLYVYPHPTQAAIVLFATAAAVDPVGTAAAGQTITVTSGSTVKVTGTPTNTQLPPPGGSPGGGPVFATVGQVQQALSDAAAANAGTFVALLAKPDAPKTATFTASATKPNLADISAGSFDGNLPPANTIVAGKEIFLKVTAATDPATPTTALSVKPGTPTTGPTAGTADTINGVAGALLMRVKNRAKRLVSDGVSNYTVLGGDVDSTVEDQRNDVRYLNVLGQYEGVGQYIDGHSFMAAPGNTLGLGRLWERVGGRLRMGSAIVNAVSSTRIGLHSMSVRGGPNAWAPGSKRVPSICCMINDAALGGSAAVLNGFRHAWRSWLSAVTSRAGVAANTASFVYNSASTWTAETAVNSIGGARLKTSTVGDYTEFVYTESGTGCDVGFIARAAGAGLITLTEGATTLGTLDLTAATADDCAATFRIRGLANGSHKIRATLTSGASMTVDGYYIPSPQPVSPVVLAEGSRDPNRGNGDLATPDGSTVNTVMTNVLRPALAAVVAEFPSAVYVDLAALGWDAPSMANDGLHPNDLGASWIATKIIQALAKLGFSQALNLIHADDNLAAYVPPANPAIPAGGRAGANTTATVADNFNRADGALAGSSTTTGAKTWVVDTAGTAPTISGNKVIAGAGTGNAFAVVPCDASDGTVQATLSAYTVNANGGVGGITVRETDVNNQLAVVLRGGTGIKNYALLSRVAGTATNLVISTAIPAVGDVIKVAMNGSSIKVYLNGGSTPIIDFDLSTLSNQSTSVPPVTNRHGLYVNNADTSVGWDDFSYTPA